MTRAAWGSRCLLPLPPHGLGTGHVESLASYSARLSAFHLVPTSAFASELLPVVFPGLPAHNPVRGRRGALMNSSGRWAQALSSRLAYFTGQEGLDRLTMRPWHRVLSDQRLIGRIRRWWCPACYAAMRADAAVCWDPLVWSLEAVTCCPRHLLRLSETCPFCQRTQRWLPRDTAIGWCVWCGSDLAAPASSQGLPSSSVEADSRAAWTARVAAELLEAAGSRFTVVTPEELGGRILGLVKSRCGGNVSAFARRSGVSVFTPRHWVRLGTLRFDHLLGVCWGLQVLPSDLLLADWPLLHAA